MKVYNENKTQLLTEYDLTKGYLKDDVLNVYIPEVKAVAEVSHYKTVKEYSNGGKEVVKVIDTPAGKGVAAHYTEEQIKVYMPYTAAEQLKADAKKEIAELKAKLKNTDYKAIKYAEGVLTLTEYEPIKTERQAWRDRINTLEKVLL
jgi:hypothetical protein